MLTHHAFLIHFIKKILIISYSCSIQMIIANTTIRPPIMAHDSHVKSGGLATFTVSLAVCSCLSIVR